MNENRYVTLKIALPSRSTLTRLLRWLTPNGGTLLLIALLIATQSIWAQPFAATTNAPGPSATTVNYQGRLADNLGTPLDGNYGMSFALYDAASAGNLVWGPEVHDAVLVSDGLFSVGLGSRTAGGIPTTTWNGDRYLEITVGGETLEPRELIRSVPIAGMALTVPDGAIGASQIADGAVGADQIANEAIGTSQIAEGAVGSQQIANASITSDKLVRTIHQRQLSSDLPIPQARTEYTVLKLSLTLERETYVTIFSSVAAENKNADTLFRTYLYVSGNSIGQSESWHKKGIGETQSLYNALLLEPGTHEIKITVWSWGSDGYVNDGLRTQLIVIEG